MRHYLWPAAVIGTVFLVLLGPLAIANQYIMRLINVALVSIIAVMGLNLVTGLTGQVSLGHAGFLAIGAYTSGLLSTRLGMSFWSTLPIVVLVGLLFGFLLALPAVRTAGVYLTIVTIGFGEIVRLVLLNWLYLGGPEGIPGIPRPDFPLIKVGGEQEAYYVALLFVALGVLLTRNVMSSRYGRAFRAIRQSETAAATLGINPVNVKVLAFCLSAAVTSVAGSLYGHIHLHVSPDMFDVDMSVTLLAMLLVGGMGTISGPVIGGFGLALLPELLRPLKAYYLTVYGLGIILLLLFMPDGIAGLLRRRVRGLPLEHRLFRMTSQT